MSAAASAFDTVASSYDALWSDTTTGALQRQAVWRRIDHLFRRGDRVLDLGCGTGVDGLHLASRGVSVHGIDESAEMVRVAQRRGMSVEQRSLSQLGEVQSQYDGALSNFGVINCVSDLSRVAANLSRLIRKSGYLTLCVMGPFCLWETLYFMRRGQFKKAFRRIRTSTTCSLGIQIRYPSTSELTAAFRPYFRLVNWCGIGLFVPPSYIRGLSVPTLERLARLDQRLCETLVLRGAADHRLYIFQRV